MATNGDSARKWLADNQHKTSEQRVKQIRDSLAKKADELSNAEEDDLDEEYQGVLDALGVMEEFASKHYGDIKPEPEKSAGLDSSPLIPNTSPEAPLLDDQEKKIRFRELLKKSKF